MPDALDDIRPRRELASESDVHDAMETLRRTIPLIGAARGRHQKAEAMLRHIKALEMTFSRASSAAAREQEAYASNRYREAIEDLEEASVAFETLKAERETAMAVIEMWRTMEATRRGATRL